jgi:type VI secretion system protein VasJ
MLGTIKTSRNWKWAAFGKHPVAGDYFNIQTDDPFFQAFSGWLENGYRQISETRKNAKELYSWRFWAKGHQKDHLICGLCRDSFDRIGRPYPLVIMGSGILSDWQSHLETLPFALEKAWIQMEYLATKRYMDYSQMETDVKRLPVPEADWSGHQEEQQHRWEKWREGGGPDTEEIKKTLREHEAMELLAPIDSNSCNDVIAAAAFWHLSLQENHAGIPNAVFLGGIPTASYIAIFRRPLTVPDFIRLWSVGVFSKSF